MGSKHRPHDNPVSDPVHVPGKVRVESVGALIARCESEAKVLGQHHPLRNLIMNCAWAMRQLVDRVAAAETKLTAAGIVNTSDEGEEM